MRIGVDVGGTNIKAVAVNPAGDIIGETSVPTRASLGPESVIEQIHTAIRQVLHQIGDMLPSAIGIGAPGSVDFEKGTLQHPPNLPGWGVIPLADIIHDRWSVPVILDNDANCAALGEAKHGAGKSFRHFIGITLGTGVGSGIIINGSIFHGEKGYGGELGHMTIDRDGPQCRCGNRGCVEAFVGNSYIVAEARRTLAKHPESALHVQSKETPEALTPKTIAEAAHAGDRTAYRILYEAGEKLGIAIAAAVNLLDISVFIIGGGISAAGEPLFEGIGTSANGRVLEVHRSKVRILKAELGNKAGMLGAASLTITS